MSKVAEIEEAEKNKMRVKCKKIIDHGINCFINRQLIYNFPEQIFTDAGVVSIEHADFDGASRYSNHIPLVAFLLVLHFHHIIVMFLFASSYSPLLSFPTSFLHFCDGLINQLTSQSTNQSTNHRPSPRRYRTAGGCDGGRDRIDL